jgi:hypothetical protein
LCNILNTENAWVHSPSKPKPSVGKCFDFTHLIFTSLRLITSMTATSCWELLHPTFAEHYLIYTQELWGLTQCETLTVLLEFD